jgi:hypothetical protein
MEGIIRGMDCPRDFECYRSGLESLGKVNTAFYGDLIECLEEDRRPCGCGMPSGRLFFCICPLRGYIAKNFHK